MAMALRPHASSRESRDYYLVPLSLWSGKHPVFLIPFHFPPNLCIIDRGSGEEYNHVGRFGHWLTAEAELPTMMHDMLHQQ